MTTAWHYFARYSARGDDEALGGQWPTPWSGTEYYVAAAMIAEGLVREGLAVVDRVYDRHVACGQLYNHIECGEHYFRPMAAWAVLPALQGLVYEAAAATLAFAPQIAADRYDAPFILPTAWGRLQQRRAAGHQRNTVTVKSGRLRLRALRVQVATAAVGRVAVRWRGRPLAATWSIAGRTLEISWARPVAVTAGTALTVTVAGAGGAGERMGRSRRDRPTVALG